MKKIKISVLLLVVLLMLTACGGGEAPEAPLEGDNTSSEITAEQEQTRDEQPREELRFDFAENALPPASQLVLGTLMLEDTDLAVNGEVAPYLVPYWKLYLNLLESETTAPEELEALIAEIQEVMDVDQVNYIAGLELTQDDLMVFINESGLMEDLIPEGGAGEGDGTRPGRPDGMPAGTGPGGGQGPGSVEGMDPEALATMEARRAEMEAEGGFNRQSSRMVVPLINALIELLESKISG